MARFAAALLIGSLALSAAPSQPLPVAPALRLAVLPVGDELRAELSLSPFYAKSARAAGVPVVASGKVSGAAVAEASRIVGRMLAGHPEWGRSIRARRIRVAVMHPTEQTTDIPEHADLTPKAYWDGRARGLGATLARPATSCGEENLLHQPGDRYPDESILVHEFAHAIHEHALAPLEPSFQARLDAAYQSARALGLWRDSYAATNPAEYWAEGVQSYFDCNDIRVGPGRVETREQLAELDPGLFRLVEAAFGRGAWRYEFFNQRRAKKR